LAHAVCESGSQNLKCEKWCRNDVCLSDLLQLHDKVVRQNLVTKLHVWHWC